LAQNYSQSISTPVPETREELAEPPVGKIQKIHLRALKGFNGDIQQRINKASESKNGAKFAAYLQDLMVKVQKATASLNKEDLFDIIPDMAAVYQEQSTNDIPEDDDNFTYIERAKHTVQSLNVPLLKSMAEYIKENRGNLTGDLAEKFATVCLVKGFICEYDWEEDPIPIGEADVFVANPNAVVKLLKVSPWRRVQIFIGEDNMTPEKYFARFESNGNGMLVLKTKYMANNAAILAKYDEIKKWVIQQEKQAQSIK